MTRSRYYRADIDGLRAIAIISVVLFHAFPKAVMGGFLGVDIFFVISGFLITGNILRELSTNSFSFRSFWAKRIRRIFPALLLVIAATTLVGWLILLPEELRNLISHIKWALGFAINVKLNNEVGYFDNASEMKPLLHLWSLAIEEQFYLVWPIILLLSYQIKDKILIITCSIAIVSFFSKDILGLSDNSTFYLPWARFWEILVGSIAAIIVHDNSLSRMNNKFLKSCLSFIGAIMITLSILTIDKTTPFPSIYSTIPVLGCAILILFGKDTFIDRQVLSSKPLSFIGLISFPWYLWHWPIMSYLHITGTHPMTIAVIISIVASLILAVITYYTLENYMRLEKGNFNWRAPTLLATAIVSFFTLQYINIEPTSIRGLQSKVNEAMKSGVKYPTASMKTFRSGEGFNIYEIETNISEHTLFIGDSHMYQYAVRIDKLSNDLPDNILSSYWLAPSCCAFLDGFKKGCTNARCDIAKKWALKAINNQENKIKRVVWTQHWGAYIDEKTLPKVDQFLEELHNTGVQIYVVMSAFTGKNFNPKTMLKRNLLGVFELNKDKVGKQHFINITKKTRNFFTNRAKKYNLTIIDPLDHWCKNKRCSVLTDSGYPYLIDSEHVNSMVAREHASFMDTTVL